METTVFLDIDGVLNDYNTTVYNNRSDILGKYNISLEKLELLKLLLNEINGSVVFISALRYDEDFLELAYSLTEMDIKIDGRTPSINDNKSLEILSYLTEHNISNYLILEDDELLDIPEIQEHLIETPTDDGLQDYLVKEAITQVNKNNQRRLVLKK